MKDLYKFEAYAELYEFVDETEFTEFRDGHPFTYPALILRNTDTRETRVVPKYALDRLTKRVPYHVVEVDCYEKFVEFFTLATQGTYTQQVNSFQAPAYVEYKTAMKRMVDNFAVGFQGDNLSNESKTLLEQFAMMLLITVEMTAARRMEEKAKSETKE